MDDPLSTGLYWAIARVPVITINMSSVIFFIYLYYDCGVAIAGVASIKGVSVMANV